MVQSLARVRDLCRLRSVQTGRMVQSFSCLLGTGIFFMGVKWQWHEADHAPSFSAEVTLCGSLTQSPVCLHACSRISFFMPETRLVATDLFTLFNLIQFVLLLIM